MDKQQDYNVKIPSKKRDSLIHKIRRNTVLRNSLSPIHYDYNFIFGSTTGTNTHTSKDNKNDDEIKFKKLNPLIDLKAFHPQKYLKYELQLNEQKKKYAPNKFYEEPIEISKSSFLRDKFKKGSSFIPCLKIAKGQIFSTKKLVYCKHKYTTSRSKSTRESFEGSFFQNKRNDNYNIANSKNSRPQSTKHFRLFSQSNSQMIQIANLIEEVKEKNSDMIQDIHAERIYNKRFILEKKTKPKSIDIKELRSQLNLPDTSNEHIDQREILQNNYEKVKICLDDKSREYLRNIYKQINYEDQRLNRVCDIKNFSIINHHNLSKIKNQCIAVSKETVKLKKTIKGVYSILPLDESKSWNKMSKSMIHFDLSDSEYLEDLINKKNALRTIKTVSKHKDMEMMYQAHKRSKRKMGLKNEQLYKK